MHHTFLGYAWLKSSATCTRRIPFVSEVLKGEGLLSPAITQSRHQVLLSIEQIMQLSLFDSLPWHRRAERRARTEEIRRKYGKWSYTLWIWAAHWRKDSWYSVLAVVLHVLLRKWSMKISCMVHLALLFDCSVTQNYYNVFYFLSLAGLYNDDDTGQGTYRRLEWNTIDAFFQDFICVILSVMMHVWSPLTTTFLIA